MQYVYERYGEDCKHFLDEYALNEFMRDEVYDNIDYIFFDDLCDWIESKYSITADSLDEWKSYANEYEDEYFDEALFPEIKKIQSKVYFCGKAEFMDGMIYTLKEWNDK